MRISDWSSDVCSSDLWRLRVVRMPRRPPHRGASHQPGEQAVYGAQQQLLEQQLADRIILHVAERQTTQGNRQCLTAGVAALPGKNRQECRQHRSEEHTSELQSLMRISYAVFCLKKKQ